MKIYKIITLITITALTIGFSACSDTAKFKSATSSVTIVDCNSTVGVTPTQYTVMQSGDVLSKSVTPTVINAYHNVNGTKTVCTEVGAAVLIR